MCEKCAQLDEKVLRCNALSKQITDPLTLNGIAILVGQYEAQRRALHPIVSFPCAAEPRRHRGITDIE